MYVQCEVPLSRQVGNSPPSSSRSSSSGITVTSMSTESASNLWPSGDGGTVPSSSVTFLLLHLVVVAVLFLQLPPPHPRPFPRRMVIRSTKFEQLVAHSFDNAGNGGGRRRAAKKMLLMMRDARP